MLIVRADERECRVNGRVAAMIAWLLDREQKINTLYNGNVQFNFRGCKLKPSLQEFGDDIEIPVVPEDG